MPKIRRPVAGGVILALAALVSLGASAQRYSAYAAAPLEGTRVSGTDVRILVAAADSCPSLTPARLAGQVMAASNFGDQPVRALSAVGAGGAAALTPEVWSKWAPWTGASLADRAASITALAHAMCQLVGQVRTVRIEGDPWRVALAAHRAGMEAVVTAGGIPSGAQDYVDTVERYASWYALQPAFGGSGQASPAPGDEPVVTDAPVVRVPDGYVDEIVAAGHLCPGMPAARIAAQIMVSSGFDPQRLGATGEQGIAQFLPQIWVSYVPPAADRTPWDPAAAIPALATTMCALIKQAGTGGYPAALAVFTRGDGDVPATALAAIVTKDQAEYAKDTRLVPAGTSRTSPAAPTTSQPPAGAPSSGRPKAPSASGKPTPGKTAAGEQPPVKGADADGSGRSYGPYFIYNFATKQCVDLPGYGAGTRDGPVNQYPCAKTGTDNQEFAFVPRAVDGDGYQLYWIRNVDDGWCVDPPGLSTVASSTSLDETGCYDADNEYFRLEPRFKSGGRQYYWLRDTVADMCLDVPGKGDAGNDARLALVPCLANDDHEWTLVRKSEW